MTEYYNVTTNLGDAEIANAIATNTKLDITHIAFGDGNGSVPTPTKTRSTLLNEVHRQAVTKYERHATNTNWIVIETIIPSDVGGFTIREMGIIANNKLISHGSHAPFEKVVDPSGVSEYRLRFTQNVTDGSVVELTLDDSLIYATQAWIDENYIPRSEIVDNLTTDDATKPASAKQAKKLQDNKLDKDANAVSASKFKTARKIQGTDFDGTQDINLPDATEAQKGVTMLVNNLLDGGTDRALTAEQGKVLFSMFAASKTENGYQKLPGGLIFQWGAATLAASTGGTVTRDVTYPISFPNAVLHVLPTYATSTGANSDSVYTKDRTQTGFKIGQTAAETEHIASWFSIGY